MYRAFSLIWHSSLQRTLAQFLTGVSVGVLDTPFATRQRRLLGFAVRRRACALMLSLGITWCVGQPTALAQPASIERSGDPLADIARLIALQPEDWQALTVADLGEVWWIVHEAEIADRARYRGFTVAVRVNGAIGYIDTRRLANAEYGMLVPYVLSDLYQSHPRGNFSILVSGAKPPYRPLGAPLRWSGFLYEGLEPPDKPLANVFDGVAVMRRTDIDFNAVNGFTHASVVLIASEPAGREQAPVGIAAAVPPSQASGGFATMATLLQPQSLVPERARANRAPKKTASSVSKSSPSRVRASAPGANGVQPATLGARTQGGSGTASSGVGQRLKRVTRFNTSLRRRVLYLETLVAGRERGYSLDMDATVGSLIDVIMQGQDQPQRNVYLRLKVSEQSKVGRIVSASRYPLYQINRSACGSHQVLVDFEIRGPDGRTILKSNVPGKPSNTAVVRGAAVQFMHINQATTLRELGVSEAVYWPLERNGRGELKRG